MLMNNEKKEIEIISKINSCHYTTSGWYCLRGMTARCSVYENCALVDRQYWSEVGWPTFSGVGNDGIDVA